ncbi:unnamed protein product [Prorocentrum cordatum]|uniref:Uncharacterized protein n=1 Tax=Prorocentrum cordatum TaxID=2364126 RepID=A0ABN9RZZ7_9DINO|nr:unnamed protein product [Polarella glacialis]
MSPPQWHVARSLALWYSRFGSRVRVHISRFRSCGSAKVLVRLSSSIRQNRVKFRVRNFHAGRIMCDGLCDEIWDYSYTNLDNYPEYWRRVQNQYVPPGYARALDLGVSVVKKDAHVENVGFLGDWEHRHDERGALLYPMYREVFGTKLVPSNGIHTAEVFIRFFTDYPVQLNTYKVESCCPSTNALTALRIAQLISNRACVISVRTYPYDEEEWQGIVHFAERSQIANLFDEKSRDVGNCQKQTFEKFKIKFKPLSILKRSGFFDVWYLFAHRGLLHMMVDGV